MGIGSKLSKLIEANNTNPNELARKVGVSPQTIFSIIKRDSKKADIEVLPSKCAAKVTGLESSSTKYSTVTPKISAILRSTSISAFLLSLFIIE